MGPMAESQTVEYKESWRDEYLKWICGFANTQGGTNVRNRYSNRPNIRPNTRTALSIDNNHFMQHNIGINRPNFRPNKRPNLFCGDQIVRNNVRNMSVIHYSL